MSYNPKISIIVPTHNRIKILNKFADCLKAQTYKNFQIILIDDGSTDGSAEFLSSQFSNTIVVRGDGNLWWGGSLHEGYKVLKAKKDLKADDIVLIINDDTQFESDYLQNAVNYLAGKNKILLGSTLYANTTKELIDCGVRWDWDLGDIFQAKTVEEINCLSTRGLFLRYDDFLELGGFHPIILPHYFSDYEYTVRAYRKGFKLLVTPEVKNYTDPRPGGVEHFDYSSREKFVKTYFSKKNYREPMGVFFFFWLASPNVLYGLKHTRILLIHIHAHMAKVPDMKLETSLLWFLIRSLSIWGIIKKSLGLKSST